MDKGDNARSERSALEESVGDCGSSKTGRMFVFGIDGATFDVMLPLMEQGKMPATTKLLEQGTWGKLLSTHPFMTPSAWTSFMTGRSPANHGVFDFRHNEMRGERYRRRFVNSNDIKCSTIFNMLDHYGKRSVVVGLPMTYPPFKINGALVSGFMTPNEYSSFTYPKELKSELLVRFGNHPLDPDPHKFGEFVEEDYIVSHFRPEQTKRQVSHFLADRYLDWDFLMVVFSAVDHIQHYFWKYTDPLHPEYNSEKGELYRKTNEYHYMRCDNFLEEFLERLSPEDTVIVISDHGGGPMRVVFNLDNWLEQNGYLRMNPRIALKNKRRKASRTIADAIRKLFSLPLVERRELRDRILYGKTRAFSGYSSEMGIYINERGKRPCGIVEPGLPYEALCQELISSLNEVREPKAGVPIFEWVRPRKEVLEGRFSDLAPDILFKTRSGYVVYPKMSDNLFDYFPEMSGTHELEGIFIARGPAIKKSHTFDSARIIDVAPTILYLLSLPIDSQMDGKVLSNIMLEQYRKDHPPQFSEYKDLVFSEPLGQSSTPDQEEVMREKLEGLGYM